MLNDWSDREPTPPTSRDVLAWVGIGVVGALLVINVVRGIVTGIWNW